MDDAIEQERIIRIARAMCRARRIDPDLAASLAIPELVSGRPLLDAVVGTEAPVWLLFVAEAKRFVAANQQHAAHL